MNRHSNGIHVHEQLDAYLDGELTTAQCKSVEAHLVECTDCLSVLEQHRLLSALLQEVPAPTGLKPAGQFVAEVGRRLDGGIVPASQPSEAIKQLHWSWAIPPLVLIPSWVFLQTASLMSNLLIAIPGAEQISKQSLPAIPVQATLSRLASDPVVAWGANVLALFVPANWGWLLSLYATAIVGMLYASWIAGWWVRHHQSDIFLTSKRNNT